MKTITLSADEDLIEAARQRAEEDRTTLNAQFQLWLADYARYERQAARAPKTKSERQERADRAMKVMRELQGNIFTGGRKFTREEMNER